MKKSILFLMPFLLLLSCQDTIVEKPDNLIEEDQMVAIIYDLALLDAIRVNNPASMQEKGIIANEYVYKKYKIDSLQFAKSNHYYAADVHNYLKLYERVQKRLETNKTKLDTIVAGKTKTQPAKPEKTILAKPVDSVPVPTSMDRKTRRDIKN